MRRWIPKSLLAVMTVLALATVGLSLHTSERISYFSTPAPGNRAVVRIFRTVVQRTLDEPSFIFEGIIGYRAPDRFHFHFQGYGAPNVIVVGSEVYIAPSAPDLSQKWGRGPLTRFADDIYGPQGVLGPLQRLLTAESVVRFGDDNFKVTTVVGANVVSPGSPGQVRLTYTVYVTDDLVSSIVTNEQGWFSVGAPQAKGHIRWERVSKFRFAPQTYGSFGAVPAFSPPPLSRTVPLTLCGGDHRTTVDGFSGCFAY
jgi:hypothetical protein